MEYLSKLLVILLIILILFIYFTQFYIKDAESNDMLNKKSYQETMTGMGVSIPGASNQAAINTIGDMRDFLEKMFMVCLLPPHDQNDRGGFNTDCSKIATLSAYLYPILYPFSQRSLNELTSLFGHTTKPTSAVGAAYAQQTQSPPPIPIILNDTDYQMFLQLVVLGNMIQPFGTDEFDSSNSIVNSVVLRMNYGNNNIQDSCTIGGGWPWQAAARSVASQYLREIKIILAYFHAQVDPSNQFSSPETVYTHS